jgi:type VI secretion system protein VasJ
LIDLQRISSEACKGLGSGYLSVNNAICTETALFLRRIPDVISLSYSNGTPFCDNTTKDWIDSDVKTILSPKGSPSEGKDGSFTDPLLEEKKEINKLSSVGKFDEAIQIMKKTINSSGLKSQNFKRELIICTLLFSAKRADIALAILESLHEKILYYHLDEWEPDLAVETWRLLIKAYKIVGNSKSQNIQVTFLERQNSILNKISCIDPNSSLKIKL